MRGVDSLYTRGNTTVQVGTDMEDGGFLNQGDQNEELATFNY